MSIVVPHAGEVEIALEELVLTAGVTRSEGDLAALFILPPVVPPIVALDLVAGRGSAPEESRRKSIGPRTQSSLANRAGVELVANSLKTAPDM